MAMISEEYYDGYEAPTEDELYLMHYGKGHKDGGHSGRYPWGSGENPYQHPDDFLTRIEQLRSRGMTDADIAIELGTTPTGIKNSEAIAKNERKKQQIKKAEAMRDKGLSNVQIGAAFGVNESTVRSWFNENRQERLSQAEQTAEFLKNRVDEVGMIEVGKGTEIGLGISETKLKYALTILQAQGYELYGGRVPQPTNKKLQTTITVLCPPGTPHKDIFNKRDEIHSVDDYISYDDGKTFKKAFQYPSSLDSKRLEIKYKEEGGIDKDGVIELRRGVKDLSLGNSNYAQVRILVDGTHYLKGMAVYSDDLPDGIDVRFNTNKTVGTPMTKVLKEIKDDPENPFGSAIKEKGGQSYYIDDDGKEKLSLINKRATEGDWNDWSNTLSAQFLSKQSKPLIDKQIKLTESEKTAEYEEIISLTNPTVKKLLLYKFAQECDSDAVKLKAAGLPRQRYQVLLPLTSIKENEIYAPNFNNGERLVLIRYPHGGTFEIPVLTVNNKNKEGRSVIGPNALDAVGIHPSVAGKLSGADFDGDTVMVIPDNEKRIISKPTLEGLKDFDPKDAYPERPGMKVMTKDNTQKQMGIISNLITDMTIKGASNAELERAVRHSMVVIDAAKHHLDYRQSEIDNDIDGLKRIYQRHVDPETGEVKFGGATTIISSAKSEQRVTKRRGSPQIQEDGSIEYKTAFDAYYIKKKVNKKTGEVTESPEIRTETSTKMAETKNAITLVSDTNNPVEMAYANYANWLKMKANSARKEYISTEDIKRDPEAAIKYKNEVDSLMAKLKVSESNKPKERLAQISASADVAAYKEEHPGAEDDEIKKVGQKALVSARLKYGAQRQPIDITDREWEAIQAGAVSPSKLLDILNHTDTDVIKQRAMPKEQSKAFTDANITRIKNLAAAGYTTAEIASRFGVSTSTIRRYLSGEEER